MPIPRPADGPLAVFEGLDATLPLVLLPIRIETRFLPDENPTDLWVRFFPDAIHADSHRIALTPPELELGKAFWQRRWRAGGEPVATSDAFAWLAAQLGPWRAAWVAGQLQPTNGGRAPTAPVPDDQPLEPAPRFPSIQTAAAATPTWARLLPERLGVVGYVNEAVFGPFWGALIPDDLPLAPGPVDTEGPLDGRALLSAQGLAWTYDLAEAERAGMALRIDLEAAGVPVRRGFTELIAIGARTGDQHDALAGLLDAHRYTHGLDLIPQGTPTNRTDTAAPGLSNEAPDLDAVIAGELAEPRARPALSDDGALYRMQGADAASVALGLERRNALDRAANAGLAEGDQGAAMNQVLWPGLGGYYLDHLLNGALTDGDRAWLRSWSASYVRGGGPLATLLVGAQPYGLLPVASLTRSENGTRSKVKQVEDLLVTELRIHWDGSLSSVPRLDPDTIGANGNDDVEAEQAALVSQVLAAVPHLTALRLRRAEPERSTYDFEYSARLALVALVCGAPPDADGVPVSDPTDSPAWAYYLTLSDDLEAATSASAQRAAFERLADSLAGRVGLAGSTRVQDDYYRTQSTWVRDALVDFAAAQAERIDPLQWLIERVPAITGKLGNATDPNAFTTLHPDPDAASWNLPLVASDRTADSVAQLHDWLVQLLGDVGTEPHYDYTITFPLLRQLVRWSVENAADPDDAAALRDGLTTLIDLVDTAADPVGELERLLRETLGVWSYRLDAWYTAVAAAQLEDKRRTSAHGLHTGSGASSSTRRRTRQSAARPTSSPPGPRPARSCATPRPA